MGRLSAMEIWAAVIAFVLGAVGSEARNWRSRRSPVWVLTRDTKEQWTLQYNRWRKVICARLSVDGEEGPRLTNDFARKLAWRVPFSLPEDTLITLWWIQGTQRYEAKISVRGDRTEIRRNLIRRVSY